MFSSILKRASNACPLSSRHPDPSPVPTQISDPPQRVHMAQFRQENIYARSLVHLGYGYPLWLSYCADPNETRNGGEWHMDVGDVGRIMWGGFRPLLSTKARLAEEQPYSRLPEDHEFFDSPDSVPIHKDKGSIVRQTLSAGFLASAEAGSSINTHASPASTPTRPGDSAAECSDTRALAARSSGDRWETSIPIRDRQFIISYMHRNAEKWEKLADDIEGGLGWTRLEDIVFVCGVTKTETSNIPALQDVRRAARESVDYDFDEDMTARPKFCLTEVTAPIMGPMAGSGNPDQHPWTIQDIVTSLRQRLRMVLTGSPSGQDDRCVFFHYYKMRRRIPSPWTPPWDHVDLYEGPGTPDDVVQDNALLEDGDYIYDVPDESGMGIDEERESMQPFDPVDDALEYIIENSLAEVAIASDLDLYALFKPGDDFPQDVAPALARLKPDVNVDEKGVGTLVLPSPDEPSYAAFPTAEGNETHVDTVLASPIPSVVA
ncbi:hypothetical protein OH77DRAFT_1066928 [Trametes cingulata]|nr:hypothetical protein OH77DRAFT_1066928 [Trametes cingulata]